MEAQDKEKEVNFSFSSSLTEIIFSPLPIILTMPILYLMSECTNSVKIL